MTATKTATEQTHFALTFATRDVAPTTHWIEGGYDADAPKPEAFFADMAAIGWTEDGMRLPAFTSSEHGCRVQEFHLTRKGTGMFAGWSTEEKRSFMAQTRRVMRKHGFVNVPVWRKTLADML